MVKKIIKAKIVGLTNIKEKLLNQEYDNLQEFLQLKDAFWWDKNLGKNLYSANKQQASRFYRKINTNKEYPISARKDLIQVEKRNTKITKYWFRIRVKGRRRFWVAIKPHQNIPDDVTFSESKILRRGKDFYVYLTIEKEVKIKKSYSNILAIDFGVKWIATVCGLDNLRPKFYGRELRRIRGHYFHLRKKVAKKKIKQYYKWISNEKEQRIVNDMIHKISRDIVNQAKETNSMIVFGKLKNIRKQNKGRRFNRKLNSFPYFKLAQYIRYKANWEGIKVVEVSEAYTSQICHKCGKKGIRNKGLFKCECGLEDNSDRNGAINIGKRVLGQVSKIGVSVNIPRTEAVSIKIPIRNSVGDLRSHLTC